MNFIKRSWINIKSKKNMICIITIIICLIICLSCLVIKIKRDSIYQIGEFETPEMFEENITQAQFGTKTLTKAEYSFIYYSILYSSMPNLKSLSYNELNDFLLNTVEGTDEEGNPRSFAQELQNETESNIIKMYSYLQDMKDKNISFDVSSDVLYFKNNLKMESKQNGYDTVDDYLSDYYGENIKEADLEEIITDYAKYIKYSEEYLIKDAQKYINQNEEDYYKQTKNIIDDFYIDILYYSKSETSVSKELDSEIKKELNDIYSKTHKREDMVTYSNSLLKKYNSEENTIVQYANGDNPMDGYLLYLSFIDIYNWVVSPDIKQDSTAIFETDNYYAVAYYNKRQKPESNSVTGLKIQVFPETTLNELGHIEIPVYEKESQSPYYQYSNKIASLLNDKNVILSLSKIQSIIKDIPENNKINVSYTDYKYERIANVCLDSNYIVKIENLKPGECLILNYNDDYSYYEIFYKTEENYPYYKGTLVNSLYSQYCQNIENTYTDMFSNISYIN